MCCGEEEAKQMHMWAKTDKNVSWTDMKRRVGGESSDQNMVR